MKIFIRLFIHVYLYKIVQDKHIDFYCTLSITRLHVKRENTSENMNKYLENPHVPMYMHVGTTIVKVLNKNIIESSLLFWTVLCLKILEYNRSSHK